MTKEKVNNNIGIYCAQKRKDCGTIRAIAYEDSVLGKAISKFANGAGLLTYTSDYDCDNNSLVFDFMPKKPQAIHVCGLSKVSKLSKKRGYFLILKINSHKHGTYGLFKQLPAHIPGETCLFKDNKLVIKLSQDKPKEQQTVERANTPTSSDIESQCHKLLQVLPDVLIKKMFSSDDLATKFANTVDYRTSRDLKALEKTLLEEMAKQQEQTEKKLSGQLTAGLNEIKGQLTDWLNH